MCEKLFFKVNSPDRLVVIYAYDETYLGYHIKYA